MSNGLMENYMSFETFLKDYISEQGKKIEDYRKKQLKKVTIFKFTNIFAPWVLLIMSVISGFLAIEFVSMFFLVLFVVSASTYVLYMKFGDFVYINYRNAKINEYKYYVQKYFKIDKILDYIGIRYIDKFSDESINLLNLAKNSGFVKQNSTTETCFCVNYLNKECIVSDIVTKVKDCDDIHTLVVKFGFNKDIKTDVFINKSNGIEENIPLEFEKFNNEFKVYSIDEVESRYLITTTFMERLLNAKKAFKFDTFEAAFLSKENVFILSGLVNDFSDVFEISDINRSVYDLSVYSQFFFEVQAIKKIAECLKLNLDIGL